MSTVERITQLSHRIFNTSVSEQSVARTSNPFASSNFQKNILTEDVFESSKNKNDVSFTGKLNASSKRIYSTFVGSITDFGSKIQEGIESIAAFCSRMKEGIVNTCANSWNKVKQIANTEVSLNGTKELLSRDVMTFFPSSQEKQIAKMAKLDPHSEVKPMLIDALSALEADMVKAA